MKRQFVISVIVLLLISMVNSHAYTGKILTSDPIVPHNEVPQIHATEDKKSQPMANANIILTPAAQPTAPKTKNDVFVFSFEQLISKILGDVSKEIQPSPKQLRQPQVHTIVKTEQNSPFGSIVVIDINKVEETPHGNIQNIETQRERNKLAMQAIRKEHRLIRKMHKKQRRERRKREQSEPAVQYHELQQSMTPLLEVQPFMSSPFFQPGLMIPPMMPPPFFPISFT